MSCGVETRLDVAWRAGCRDQAIRECVDVQVDEITSNSKVEAAVTKTDK